LREQAALVVVGIARRPRQAGDVDRLGNGLDPTAPAAVIVVFVARLAQQFPAGLGAVPALDVDDAAARPSIDTDNSRSGPSSLRQPHCQ
jgi:hypothetical protein